MAAAVEFNAKKLFKYLNPLEASQLRYAGNIALKRIGFSLAKQEIPNDMKKYFDRPVPFTQRSVNYTVEGDTLTLRVNQDSSKGNAPSKYLFPVTAAGARRKGSSVPVYPTRFANWLWNRGYVSRSQFPIPNEFNAEDVRLNQYGNVTSATYQRTQVAISRSLGSIGVTSLRAKKSGITADRAIIVKTAKGQASETGDKRVTNLSPGIYRVKTDGPKMLFALMNGLPSASAVFPYQENVFSYARVNFPRELRKQIQEGIARTPV